MGVSIKYGDFAPEAKENFEADVTSKAPFVNLKEFNEYNLRVGDYANPCEGYQTLLDSTAEIFPDNAENIKTGYWSDSVSDENGKFPEPIVFTFIADTKDGARKYTSSGVTLTFDTDNNIYPKYVKVQWYRVNGETEELLHEQEYTPNSAFYFCQGLNEENKPKIIEYYNKVIITIDNMCLPYNRLKLRSVDYGYGTVFMRNELREVNIIQEINPISDTLPINVCDFTLDSKTNIEYSFQAKQPLSVYYDDKLKATVFVDRAQRTSKNLWKIESEDYTGILDRVKFMGGMYFDKCAHKLLEEIFAVAKVPYTITSSLGGENCEEDCENCEKDCEKVSGYIPICSCREAVRKVCFATQRAVSTINSDTYDIVDLDTGISQDIDKGRIRRGQTFTENDRVTEVQLTYHKYSELPEEAPDASTPLKFSRGDYEIGEELFVEFKEPFAQLRPTGCEILESGTNYAKVKITNASGSLQGRPYKHETFIKKQQRKDRLESEIDNIKIIDNETLVSASNVDEILPKIFQYYTNSTKANMLIEEASVVAQPTVKYGEKKYGEFVYGSTKTVSEINAGDIIRFETEYMGVPYGRIYGARYNLNSNKPLKEVDVVYDRY